MGRFNFSESLSWSLDLIPDGGAPLVPPLAAGTQAITGTLAEWQLMPDNGPYQLRLWAIDRAGHESTAAVDLTVVAAVPGPPQSLQATVGNLRDVVLSWQAGEGPAPEGYHVYRDGVRINPAPITTPGTTDLQLTEAIYTYTVTAVGPGGRESDPSAAVTVEINYTPPTVHLSMPVDNSRVGGEVQIHGTAHADHDFKEYRLLVRSGGDWIGLVSNPAQVIGDLLGTWSTLSGPWPEGLYELRLEGEDTAGNIADHTITVTLDNTAPDPAVLLQAVAAAEDGDGLVNDIHVEWLLDPEPGDFGGYYLYRNGLLANADGPVMGPQTPYLLAASDYHDKDLPDGTYTYFVTAADLVGNESSASNSLPAIVIDVHRPQAIITDPADGSSFEGSLAITAECPDQDLVT
ncbi:MAG: fibronectin type III domain-containing protein, partial [bacterium]|nr:fibronectin type III domain-containing protein [bacterium]